VSAPILAPVFVLRVHGAELPARAQRHNDAWNEARFLSFERGLVELVRLSDGGGCAIAGSFEHGRPVRTAVGVAS